MKTNLVMILMTALAANTVLVAAEKKPNSVTITNGNAVVTFVKAAEPKQKSFVETLSFRPYAGGFASLKEGEDTFDFNHGSVGLELSVPIYKTVDLCLDAVGIDNTSDDPVVDRVGASLGINFPVKNSKLEFYAQSGLGFWFGDEALDVMLRGGIRYNFVKQFGVFSDVGTGVSLKDGNSYQQLRGGLNFRF